ncbi:MAG: hypothetical protein KZQ90_20545 [Candidatus Thiodiazotropha sp. (ex Codakia rugifera)]|nr:hypothetical protein [Candidatus Thiodiazotropha sp. (ex Codakia rugifera)]
MLRKTVFIILILFSGLVSSETEFKSQEEFSQWLTYYYLDPEPKNIVQAVRYMSERGFLDNGKTYPPIFGFLAGVFKENPSNVNSRVNNLSSLKDSSYGVVVLGLWYANLPNSKERVYAILEKRPLLREQFNYLYQGSPMGILQIPLEQGPWVLDALWGNFMATGNAEPVARIMEALPWLDVKGETHKLRVAGAARWSLTSNAEQHKKVMVICENEIKKQPPAVQDKLKTVISESKKGPNEPIKPTQ